MDFLNPDGSAHSSVPILLSIRVGLGRFGETGRALMSGIEKRMRTGEWIF
jgi:hypothetical protein